MSPLDTTIRRFQGADRNTRLETLLDYSRKLPPLPPELEELKAKGVNRVPECQTEVYLWVKVDDEGRVHLYADVPRESPTVRGFLALLVKNLENTTPADVAAVPDDILDRLALTETLGMMRTQGLTAILGRIKRGVREGAARAEMSP